MTSDGRREGGYSLIELLVVITILAILAALLMTLVRGAIERSKVAATLGMIRVLDAACSDYRTIWGSCPPGGSSSNLHACLGGHRFAVVCADPMTVQVYPPLVAFKREWLGSSAASTLPEPPLPVRDAWGKVVLYANPGTVHPRHVDIWSVGRDDADAVDDVGNWGPEYGS
jgi:general secretion pathway protein G